jgi:hypothetical protein
VSRPRLSSTSPPAGTPAADQPVLPPWNGDGHAGVRTRPDDRGDLAGVAGRTTQRASAGEPPGPVRLVRRLEIRVDEHVPFADDAGQDVDQIAHDSTRSRIV